MKRILTTAIFIVIVQTCFACDICGCSSGNYFIGPFPQFKKHFFGLRYSIRSYKSVVADDVSEFSNDIYQTAELWGGMNIGKRWQLIAFVPYNVNKQTSDDGDRKNNGIGDISIIVNYSILKKQTADKRGNRISQQLAVGAGLKLPTGKFDADANDIIPSASNQVGTGSVDFILNALYNFHINDWGLNSNINYKMNRSASNYRFGNRFNASAFVYRTFSMKKSSFNPNIGIIYENLASNKLNKLKVEDSGGNAFIASAGLEINFKKVAVGFNVQAPLSQHYSAGQTSNRYRGMLHISFLF